MNQFITLPKLVKVLNILLLIPLGGELICLAATLFLLHTSFAHEVLMTLLLAFPILAIVDSLCAVIILFHIGTKGIPRILAMLAMSLSLFFIGLIVNLSGTNFASSGSFFSIVCSPLIFFLIAIGVMFFAPNAKILP